MIKKELYKTREDGVNLYKSYSDENYYIKQTQTGNIYEEAIDIENSLYSYQETDIQFSEEATEQDYINALAKLGGKIMKKKELEEKTKVVINETSSALQTVYDSLNQGQQQKILKDVKVKELFDRYNVIYD